MDNTTPHQIEALKLFVSETTMVHAYQMLLLLVMLSQADEGGRFSLQTATARFTHFYQARIRAGLVAEKQHGSKQAATADQRMRSTITSGNTVQIRRKGEEIQEKDPL